MDMTGTTNARENPNDWGSSLHVHALVLMGLTGVGIYLCFRMMGPFLPAFAWAMALAVVFAPLHRWLETRVKHAGLSATIGILVVVVIVLVPATFIMDRMLVEAARGAQTIKALVVSGEWRRVFDAHPKIAPVGQWLEQQIDLPGFVQTAASWLTNAATSFVRGSLLQITGVVLTFYMLFYLLRDRRAGMECLRAFSPLGAADMTRLFADVFDTIRATVYGTLVVAGVQGTLGGLMFWWLGLPAPLLWGLVMGLLAVIPVLGAFIVWVPAAAYLLLAGSAGKALILVLWGAVVVGGVDNLLYPMLVGRLLKLHTVVTFVSIVGGLVVFGGAGLILGPVVFTATRVLLEVWGRRNAMPTV